MSKTDYYGIDYGLGKSNINKKTKIRYGVIPFHEVLQAWADSSEPFYEYFCPYCGGYLKKGQDAKRCPVCYKKINPDTDFDFIEPSSFYYKEDDYILEQGFNDTDIFILKSPFYTYAQFCSPCAPGACYLINYTDKNDNNKCYCLGPDWFDDSKTPYPVYSVKTNKLIEG